ncbi:MAG: PilX N-terminal domain-containing pilus assembly protein [Candidatus Binatia bacterium]
MKDVIKREVQSSTLIVADRMLNSEKGIALIVVLMVMVILLSITGAGLFFSGVELKMSSNFRSGNRAFYAADTGIDIGRNQLQFNQALASAPFSGTIDGDLAYRSGSRNDTVAQPLQYEGMRIESGFSIGTGTGYNPSGYTFYQYQINVTGTGPRGSAREIEAKAEYGPVAQ